MALHPYNAETGRIAGLKSAARRAEMKRRLEFHELSKAPAIAEQVQQDAFVAERLARVRGQLRMIDSMIETERDANKLDRLASAQARLAIQEQNLAGRPLPGSFRPSKTRTVGPSSIEPEA